MADSAPVTAVLGPTNTGKTHRAIQRMLEHETGMLGFPLRLLAREVYDRVTSEVGEAAVALVTGEEKRIGARARYFICTVEAMPIERPVQFLGVDEIQLAAHPERGHVFTDRLLRARGSSETWFMGADTLRPLIERLVPSAAVRRHPRLSRLRHAGSVSLSALPPRSAVVAFSMARVYELAERLRTRRGGAAVVLGALSPRARNAQVALYQSGEVQYLVATDAIGMGLNLDLHHVAFADLRKFDGRQERRLEPAELAQIAGRAGRHLNDGSFGTLSPLEPLDPRVARAIEQHRFAPEQRLYYRNSDLDVSSLDALAASLKRPPPDRCLVPIDTAEDAVALASLSARPDIRERATAPSRVELLWNVCRVPDFQQLMLGQHIELLAEIYLQLTGSAGRLDEDWMARRIARIDQPSGDIDMLLARLAFIRTWTYITHQSGWLRHAEHWQARSREVEDRLSDALHQALVDRFIARTRRTSAPARAASGHPFEQLQAMRARLAPAAGEDAPESFVGALVDAAHQEIELTEQATLVFRGQVVGRLKPGPELLRPEVSASLPEEAGPGDRLRAQRRLVAWTRDFIAETFDFVPDRQPLGPAARGLLYQLGRGLGVIRSRAAKTQIDGLLDEDREALARRGVDIGSELVVARGLLEPAAQKQRRALASLSRPLPPLPPATTPHFAVPSGVDEAAYLRVGYAVYGARAIRADLANRVARRLRALGRDGAFELPPEVRSWIGGKRADVTAAVEAFGYRACEDGRFVRRGAGRRRRRRRPRARAVPKTGSD